MYKIKMNEYGNKQKKKQNKMAAGHDLTELHKNTDLTEFTKPLL